ncbi:hypothetical protein GE061_003793 [Apolygus lucorum]|uniref:Gustatory receptor n=1 Tax=Apolygus lucorum TaxID=248454 RepID=A0A6A4JCA1_APOLU|nr:hypothetical protein GE061_003793 [Apolygus lucorum]
MIDITLSKMFGTFPVDRRFKVDLILKVFSVGVFLFCASELRACFVLQNLEVGEMVKVILDEIGASMRLMVWLSQLTAVWVKDKSVLNSLHVQNTSTFIGLLASVTICLGFPILEGVLSVSITDFFTYSRFLPAGLTRSVLCLILNQFIVGVNSLTKDFDDRMYPGLFESMVFQKEILKRARKLNEFYKVQLLFCSASLFFTLTCESYYLIARFSETSRPFFSNDIFRMMVLAEESMWFALAFFWLFKLVSSCEKFHEKMDDFNDQIYNAIKKNDLLKTNKKLQLCAIKRPNVIFTACRFFNIGYPLVTSIIAAAATIHLKVVMNGFPILEGVLSTSITDFITYDRFLPAGLTRSVLCLILNQFIVGVNSLTKDFDDRMYPGLFESIAFQKGILKRARELNDFYKVQLLFCSASILFTLTCESYYLLARHSDKSVPMQLSDYFSMIVLVEESMWFAVTIFWLLNLVSSCEKFHEKMDDFNDQIYDAVKRNDLLKKNKKLQLCAIKRPTVTFTACKFFNIGYPLITSIIAAAATYLIILVEFAL